MKTEPCTVIFGILYLQHKIAIYHLRKVASRVGVTKNYWRKGKWCKCLGTDSGSDENVRELKIVIVIIVSWFAVNDKCLALWILDSGLSSLFHIKSQSSLSNHLINYHSIFQFTQNTFNFKYIFIISVIMCEHFHQFEISISLSWVKTMKRGSICIILRLFLVKSALNTSK